MCLLKLCISAIVLSLSIILLEQTTVVLNVVIYKQALATHIFISAKRCRLWYIFVINSRRELPFASLKVNLYLS